MAKPTLGVMALYLRGRRLEELRYFRLLFRQAQKIGLEMIVFTPEDVDSNQNRVHAWLYTADKGWHRSWKPLPTIIYDRCRYQRTYRYEILRKFRETHRRLQFMSRPIALKWGIHQLLSKNRAIRNRLPATAMYRKQSDLHAFLQKHPLLYMKPIDGTGGRGVIRIQRLKDGTYRVEARDRNRRIVPPMRVQANEIASRLARFSPQNRYMIQQGIDTELTNGRVHDFRLLMQKNGQGEWKATGCAGRIGAHKSVTSNLHGGGSAMNMLKLLRMRFRSNERAQSIARSMEELGHHVVVELERQYGSLVELALDIAVDEKGQVWLLEINPKPSREVFREIGEKETYAKAISRPLEYALYLSRQKANDH